MITHTIEVEQLLGQYDPGMILVGPLLSLSMSSSFRYFYVAGNGSKVYETISLGFVEFETNARTQRADFIDKLNNRFSEVLIFGSRLEMAHAVRALWPNKETAIFLESAERELTKPTVADQCEGVHDDNIHVGVTPGDNGRRLVDEVAPESVDSAELIDGKLTHVPPWTRDDEQPMPMLRPAHALVPSRVPISALSQPLRRDRAVIAQRRHSGLSQDDVASAILRLKSPAEVGGIPGLPVDGGRSSVSIFLRFCAAGGSLALIAGLIAWGMVRTSTWQVANHAAPNRAPAAPVSVRRNKGDSQTEATAVPPSDPNYITEANKRALQADPVPSPPSEPSQMASVPAGSAPVSGPQSLPVQGGSAARQLDADEIASLINRGTDSLKSGDLASARLLLRRAAEAGSASAALMLGTTFDPLALQQLGAIGVVPDVAQARQWYEKAAALGSESASQRLAKLGQIGH